MNPLLPEENWEKQPLKKRLRKKEVLWRFMGRKCDCCIEIQDIL